LNIGHLYGNAIAHQFVASGVGQGMIVPKRKLLASIAVVVVCLLGRVSAAQAGAIQLNDFSDMSAGETLAPFPPGFPPNPLKVTAGEIKLTYETGFFGFTLDDGSLFAFPSDMTPVLINNRDNGSITIVFSTGVQEFGFLAQNVAVDFETFTFDVFGPTSLLNTFSVGPADNTVPPAGVALFLGARATDTDVITRLVVSSTSSVEGSDNFFAVGPMTFVEAPAADVPEPASLLLLGTGLLGAGVRLRRRHTRA